eukprot:COSAG02_NODE_2015_length_10106_cov_9.031578_7_plen_188_part_00
MKSRTSSRDGCVLLPEWVATEHAGQNPCHGRRANGWCSALFATADRRRALTPLHWRAARCIRRLLGIVQVAPWLVGVPVGDASVDQPPPVITAARCAGTGTPSATAYRHGFSRGLRTQVYQRPRTDDTRRQAARRARTGGTAAQPARWSGRRNQAIGNAIGASRSRGLRASDVHRQAGADAQVRVRA